MTTSPMSFGRHLGAVAAGSAVGSTAYTMFAVASLAAQGAIMAALAFVPLIWMGSSFFALLFGGFWLSLVWPVTRWRRSKASAVAITAGGAGAVVSVGWPAALAGKPVGLAYFATFGILGVFTGAGYWWVARRDAVPAASASPPLEAAPVPAGDSPLPLSS